MGTASVAEEITQRAQLPWVAGVLALLSLLCSAPSGSLLWPSVLDLSLRVLVDRVIASSQEPGKHQLEVARIRSLWFCPSAQWQAQAMALDYL